MSITGSEVCLTCHALPPEWMAVPESGATPHPVCDRCRRSSVKKRLKVRFLPIGRPMVAAPDPGPGHAQAASEQMSLISGPALPPKAYVGSGHPETAQAMQARAFPRSGTFRLLLLQTIARAPSGMTDYELEAALNRSHQSTSGSRNGLVADGWLTAAVNGEGDTLCRVNRFGNRATVWVATPKAMKALSGRTS